MTIFTNVVFLTLIVFARYVLVAGFFYLLCNKWKKNHWESFRLSPKVPDRNIVLEEFKASTFTSVIFGIAGAWIFYAWENHQSLIYQNLNEHGIFYSATSFLILMFLQDTYFYWTHRLLHIPYLYKTIHKTHHISIYPSAFAAFCFHPVEAVIQAAFLPLVIYLLPLHPITLISYLTIMTVISVINHVGYELYPNVFLKNKILKTFINATNHSQHHLYNQCNFGLYFTWWDSLMNTAKEEKPKREIHCLQDSPA